LLWIVIYWFFFINFALLKSCGIIYKHIPDCDDFHLSYYQCYHVLPPTSTQNTMHKIQPVTYLHTLLTLFITKYVYSIKHANTIYFSMISC
jgi:hypothetical protein